MKKFTAIVIIALIFASTVITSLASESITLSKSKSEPGDSITISGTAQPNSSIVIKITDEYGNIVFFDVAKADASGAYSVTFTVPGDITAKTLTVIAGSGSDIVLTVVYPAAPTTNPTPTATPTTSPKPTATPTTSPKPTAKPTASPKPTATATASPKPDETPTPSPSAGHAVVIAPVTVEEDEETGTVTIGIEISDLPEGTYAVQTPDRNIIYVKDAMGGVLWIEMAQDDISNVGEIELIAIGEDKVPLAAVRVQMRDIPVTGDGAPALLWWGIGGGVVLLTVMLIVILVITKKNTAKKSILD